MNKKRLAGILLCAPIALLCACAQTPKLSFTANWNYNTTVSAPDGTHEVLRYEVTAKPDVATENFSVKYDTGSYTTELKNEMFTLEDGKTVMGYVFTTALAITGKYTVNGVEGETFSDSVTSKVRFLSVTDTLKPIDSEKTVKCTIPLGRTPSETATPQNFTGEQHYTFKTTYDTALTSATVNYINHIVETDKTDKTMELKSDATFIDNEQIIFALRGLNLKSSHTFSTINQTQRTVMDATVSATAVDEAVNFLLDGARVEKTIKAYSASVAYKATLKGQSQTAIYADVTNPIGNEYRSVLLKMEVPTMYGLSVMTYTLAEATFSANN